VKNITELTGLPQKKNKSFSTKNSFETSKQAANSILLNEMVVEE